MDYLELLQQILRTKL